MTERDISRLGAGARRQIALDQLEQARREMVTLQAPAPRSKRRSKYGNKPVTLHGHRFASQAEGRYFLILRAAEQRGEITGLKVHPVYRLTVKGVLICRYIGDFEFKDAAGRRQCHDVKGGKQGKPLLTPVFRLKRKLMKLILNIDVKVILA